MNERKKEEKKEPEWNTKSQRFHRSFSMTFALGAPAIATFAIFLFLIPFFLVCRILFLLCSSHHTVSASAK